MAFCRNCGTPLGEGQHFCAGCGQPVAQAEAGAPSGVAPPPVYPPAPAYAPGQPYGQPMYAAPQPRRSRGFWIGLSALVLAVVAVACVLVFVVFHDGIFKSGDSASNPPGTVAGETGNGAGKDAGGSPNAVLASATAAIGTSKSVTGSFDLKLSIQADASKVPAEQAQLYSKPLTLSGTMAYENGNQAGDFTVSLGMMGQTMDVGLRVLGDKAWVSLAGQWYEAPSDTQQQLAGSGVSGKLGEVQGMLSNLAIDPVTWFKDQAAVKEETIDGTKVLHLSGSNPDWPKLLGDLQKITQSSAFSSLMSSAGSTASSLESQLPSADQLQQMQSQLAAVFKNVKIDVWVEKATSLLRKATIVLDVVPAAGTDSTTSGSSLGGCDPSGCDLSGSGITGINLNATITLDPNQPVSVEAPASAKSADALQADLQANPSLLGPLGGMMSGCGSS